MVKKDKPKKILKRDMEKTLQFSFKGILLTPDKKKFRAVVRVKNRRFDLGIFNTERQAISAYAAAQKKYRRILSYNKKK